jgi:heat shock protein HslJ
MKYKSTVYIIALIPLIFFYACAGTNSLFQKNAEFENRKWILQSFNYNDVSNPDEKIFIRFNKDDKKLAGFGGCNTLFGSYSITGSDIKIKPGRTKMMCDENMLTEEKFMQLLESANEFREITSSDKDYLRLLTPAGESIEFRLKK